MNGPRIDIAVQPPVEEARALQARIDSLRSEGAWRLDPARFHYLEALSRRLASQPEPVRRILQDKLQTAVAEYAGRFATAHQADAGKAVPLRVKRPVRAVCAPLAQLNEYIRDASGTGRAAPTQGGAQEPDELANVRRFRRAWSSSRTLDQMAQAAARKPANAGPLNSHALVLQSLALMGELSPEYLRRFLVHVESLQWLERTGEKVPRDSGKQGKKGKPGKTAKPERQKRLKKER